MKFNWLNRKVHYWVGAIIALPLLVIIASGILLQFKKHWSWVQPPEQRGTGALPAVGFEAILASVRQQPNFQAVQWGDITRLDVRPGRGVVKVLMASGWEVQVDLGTGRVLQSAIRRSDWIEALHDGSLLGGDWMKLGVFLPCALGLLILLLTGLWLFLLPLTSRRKLAR